jgi:methylase of polypeptide subunit release factors
VLQSLGQASAVFGPYICENLATRLEGLAGSLTRPGAVVLDVGVGVGSLAAAFAKSLPGARIVGLDVWETSLELARANIAQAGLRDRIELRKQDICDLDDRDTYDLVWFSGPFIPGDLQPLALERCARAMKPGAWLVYGAFGGHDPLSSALADLRTFRSGGPVLSDEELIAMLNQAGLKDVHSAKVDLAIPSRMIVGRR